MLSAFPYELLLEMIKCIEVSTSFLLLVLGDKDQDHNVEAEHSVENAVPSNHVVPVVSNGSEAEQVCFQFPCPACSGETYVYFFTAGFFFFASPMPFFFFHGLNATKSFSITLCL